MKDTSFKKYAKLLLRVIPDRLFLELLYYKNFKKFFSFSSPKTFNEKMQYIKLYQTDQIFADLSDKFLVRDYVAKKIPEDILIPLLWVGENPSDIPFDSLPERYIIKCNHGSGYNIFVYDKNTLNKSEVRVTLQNWLKEDFWTFLRENHYRKIRKKLILIEELLPPDKWPLPVDLRLHCFHGKVEFIALSIGRGSPEWITTKIYNSGWWAIGYGIEYPEYNWDIPKPKNLEKMVQYSEILSAGFPFVRIDLYNVHGKIYFGEMTFTAYSGYKKFYPDHDEVDRFLWDLMILDK